ncbi:MAG: UDP-N-acetylmuramate--L-alanine ligase [Clostridiales bacterium]|jgi:UDP-N-acetylmuramate--alanine ligase|nr:UDP-N-acetylmuramate--L-alanine ligase [Clostridiales bacterium]
MPDKYQLGGLSRLNRAHFVGIGGVNMNCLARLLARRGVSVSGSDRAASSVTDSLAKEGIAVSIGHGPENVPEGCDLVVYTSAAPADNPELLEAARRGVPAEERAVFLGRLMSNYARPVCVAGTHGKTTTTSMLTRMLMAAGANPTSLIGGSLSGIDGCLLDGGRDVLVAESCEYHRSFLWFSPFVSVVLNIEEDHLDYYKDLDDIRGAFSAFARRTAPSGAVVINASIPDCRRIAGGSAETITFGAPGADWTAENIEGGRFDAVYRGRRILRARLSVLGRHNVDNALAAFAVCRRLGVDLDLAAEGLTRFTGADRRFQCVGQMNGADVIDDYAHHPTEIKATLSAAREASGGKVWAVFQPHTKSRTLTLLDEFAACFEEADVVIPLDIYIPAGREESRIQITSADLAGRVAASGADTLHIPGFAEAERFLRGNVRAGDIVLCMGAGSVTDLAARLVSE